MPVRVRLGVQLKHKRPTDRLAFFVLRRTSSLLEWTAKNKKIQTRRVWTFVFSEHAGRDSTELIPPLGTKGKAKFCSGFLICSTLNKRLILLRFGSNIGLMALVRPPIFSFGKTAPKDKPNFNYIFIPTSNTSSN